MRKTIKSCILACVLGSSIQASAQVDPHFSQYYVYPSFLNPALTGAFDGSYRVAGIYRSQWGSVTSPYSTPGLAADFNTGKGMNFGGSILNQKAGDGGYNYTTAYASAAFTGVKFGDNGDQHILFGMQAGIINRSFNPSKLSFGDQWNPINGYNPGVPSADVLKTNSATTFDVGAGAMYYDGRANRNANLYFGFSASHLTQPKDPFSVGGNEKLPIRYTAHAGIRLKMGDNGSITPNALYMRQGNAEEKMLGAYASLKAAENTDFLFAANYRFEDAISPFVGFNYKNMTLGVSYDVNTSDLGKRVNGASSFEVSLTFIGKKKTRIKEENFFCPRL